MGASASLQSHRVEHHFDIVFSYESLARNQKLCKQRSASKAYAKYIKNGFWMNKVVSCLPPSILSNTDDSDLQFGFDIPEGLKLILSNSPRNSVRTSPSRSFDGCYYVGEKSSLMTIVDLRLFLLCSINDHYLTSGVYRDWKREKGNGSQQSLNSNSELSETSESLPLDAEIDEALSMLLTAAAHFDEDEYVRFLGEDLWAINFIDLIHNHSVAVTVCSVDAEYNFPLLYANKAWEKLTQFSLEEVKGTNIFDILGETDKFTSKSEKKLKEALQAGHPLKIGLECRRNFGSFLNLLGVAPIYKETGDVILGRKKEYRGVVMVHLEAVKSVPKIFAGVELVDGGAEDGSPTGKSVRVGIDDFQLANELLGLLPYAVRL